MQGGISINNANECIDSHLLFLGLAFQEPPQVFSNCLRRALVGARRRFSHVVRPSDFLSLNIDKLNGSGLSALHSEAINKEAASDLSSRGFFLRGNGARKVRYCASSLFRVTTTGVCFLTMAAEM
jgi:hypothetical protein